MSCLTLRLHPQIYIPRLIRLYSFFQFEGATRLFAVGRRILEPLEIMDLFLVSGTGFHCCSCAYPSQSLPLYLVPCTLHGGSQYFRPFRLWYSIKLTKCVLPQGSLPWQRQKRSNILYVRPFEADNFAKSILMYSCPMDRVYFSTYFELNTVREIPCHLEIMNK